MKLLDVKKHIPKNLQKKYALFIMRFLDNVNEQMEDACSKYFSVLSEIRLDVKDPFDGLLEKLAKIILDLYTDTKFIVGISKIGNEVFLHNDKFYGDKIFQLIGFNEIPYFKKKTWLDAWTNKNVNLIKGISEENAKNVANIFYDAVGEGTSRKEIVKKLKKQFGYNDARAKLIADDQINKLNANIDRVKQRQNGVTHFFWRTVGDLAVRSKHQKFNDKRYSWKKGANGVFPGQEVRCRCFAEPDLSPVFGKDFLKDIDLENDYEQAEWLKEENRKELEQGR